jgi:hypothetical protein
MKMQKTEGLKLLRALVPSAHSLSANERQKGFFDKFPFTNSYLLK